MLSQGIFSAFLSAARAGFSRIIIVGGVRFTAARIGKCIQVFVHVIAFAGRGSLDGRFAAVGRG